VKPRRWSSALAVLAVVTAYLYFASGGDFRFSLLAPERVTDRTEPCCAYYAALAEAFLQGRLDMAYPLDPRWQRVANAYDFNARAAHGLEWEMWDASLYGGKFYLYFSPLPVLLFYVPFRLVAGAYPPDALVAMLASIWAFLVWVAFARRALGAVGSDPSWGLTPLATPLVIGLANVIPYTLTNVRAYEVAIATGMAMTASWAYALLRWTESGATRHAVLMSLWLALAIATRPNLIVLVAITAIVLIAKKNRRAMIAALVPLVLVAAMVGTYNYARFGNPLELGVTYQISYEPMWRHPFCSVCDGADVLRFFNNVVHYVFWTPRITGAFPFVELQNNVMDPAASFRGGPEPIGGAASLNPLILLGTLFALLLIRARNAATTIMAAGWLVLFGLATCRWVTARYSLDFMLMLSTASAVLIENGLTLLERAGVRAGVLRAGVMLVAAFSIAAGLLLGK
jgi:hypothetical protein